MMTFHIKATVGALIRRVNPKAPGTQKLFPYQPLSVNPAPGVFTRARAWLGRSMCPSQVLEHNEAGQSLIVGLHHANGVGGLQADGNQIGDEGRPWNRKSTAIHQQVLEAETLAHRLDESAIAYEMLAYVWIVPRPLKRLVLGIKAPKKLAVSLPLRSILEPH